MKNNIPKINWIKLNGLLESGEATCTIYSQGDEYRVDGWRWLEPGESGVDPEDESFQNADGSYCGLVAISDQEFVTYRDIGKIFVGYLTEII